MKRGQSFVVGLAAALALVVAAGGDSPTSPGASGVTLRGVALDESGSAAAEVHARSATAAKSGGSPITVTVLENPALTTTISGSGTFELQDLPPGTFTLVFSRDGVTIGTVSITSVPSEAQIDLVVKISNGGVIMVKIEINGSDDTETQTQQTCMIAGGKVGAGIQLEGSVSAPAGGSSFTMAVNGQRSGGTVTVDYAGASFSCAGIKGDCDATLVKAGARVHVSGNLTACSTSGAAVTASKIKFQH